ncbi:hypothetical protein P255_02432 [Acinetobacter brisouii CIP 110357]|uniref:Lipoprotein n=1 Tax=Acinetobacter brisouii CIP 110357 TaxID=1341683 RepID=V2UP70_9GAMM|nr:GNA1162 family protein [Acinetobacter brisouii]ENV47148.1 hypothetical protein F954_01949 [Acinetobacter brisouii ANC 4119]ESK50450.1 hypothetical protein P255_02432 [Acinetobacter brisouii CIP 110357]
MKNMTLLLLACFGISLTGCATHQAIKPQYDATVYKQHMPHSILILPPVNDSPEPRATYSFWSTTTVPVAEAGYYVFPLSIVDRMFKENGVTNGHDAQSIPAAKLKEIFGADAGLYIHLKEYGSKYQVIQTTTTVSADAKLVDLNTGTVLWTGSKRIVLSNNDNNNNLIAMLVISVVDQVINQKSDSGYKAAAIVSSQMLNPTQQGGIGLLYGPRSPKYQP